MLVIVFEAVLELRTQIKSLIVRDDKKALNNIERKSMPKPLSSNMPVVVIKIVIELETQIQFYHYQQARQVIYSHISQTAIRLETQCQASKLER